MTSPQPQRKAMYAPDVFDVATMDAAKAVILTPEGQSSTQDRWETETRWLTEDIGKRLSVGPDTCILDYGCGIGRLSKALIDRFGCRVIGVDFSGSMQLLAPEYVLSDRFVVWSPQTLEKMVEKGFRCDACICLWVIQHVLDPADVIKKISSAIKPYGLFYTLNQFVRCVPTNVGWVSDGYDIQNGLRSTFKDETSYQPPLEVVGKSIGPTSMINVMRNVS